MPFVMSGHPMVRPGNSKNAVFVTPIVSRSDLGHPRVWAVLQRSPMSIFKYQPYYMYNGPTVSQPFREELSEEQVKFNIDQFFQDLGHFFMDVGAKFEAVGDGFVAITADITQDECDERVKRCLNSLDLYANKAPAS